MVSNQCDLQSKRVQNCRCVVSSCSCTSTHSRTARLNTDDGQACIVGLYFSQTTSPTWSLPCLLDFPQIEAVFLSLMEAAAAIYLAVFSLSHPCRMRFMFSKCVFTRTGEEKKSTKLSLVAKNPFLRIFIYFNLITFSFSFFFELLSSPVSPI